MKTDHPSSEQVETLEDRVWSLPRKVVLYSGGGGGTTEYIPCIPKHYLLTKYPAVMVDVKITNERWFVCQRMRT